MSVKPLRRAAKTPCESERLGTYLGGRVMWARKIGAGFGARPVFCCIRGRRACGVGEGPAGAGAVAGADASGRAGTVEPIVAACEGAGDWDTGGACDGPAPPDVCVTWSLSVIALHHRGQNTMLAAALHTQGSARGSGGAAARQGAHLSASIRLVAAWSSPGSSSMVIRTIASAVTCCDCAQSHSACERGQTTSAACNDSW